MKIKRIEKYAHFYDGERERTPTGYFCRDYKEKGVLFSSLITFLRVFIISILRLKKNMGLIEILKNKLGTTKDHMKKKNICFIYEMLGIK